MHPVAWNGRGEAKMLDASDASCGLIVLRVWEVETLVSTKMLLKFGANTLNELG